MRLLVLRANLSVTMLESKFNIVSNCNVTALKGKIKFDYCLCSSAFFCCTIATFSFFEKHFIYLL